MLEGYITPLLMSYLDKYVKNIKPSDLQLSFWGGDAVLRNLALRVEVLEKELRIPLEFTSGRIRELTLHIPWNAIASSPVKVTIKDLELVIKLRNVRAGSNAQQPSESTDSLSSTVDPPTAAATPVPPSDKDKAGEQAPGYLQTYLSRISNNIQVHVQNLVVKVMEEECDLMLTLNIGEVDYFTADENWEKKFIYTDYLQGNYAIHKVCTVSDMMVNLHTIEMGGQETASHEPFLQRCSFTFRTRSEYRGNIFVKKSSNILFDSLTFSVDEKQFCLFLHLLDWLLAMYYSSKRLKGRDDQLNDAQRLSKTDVPKSPKNVPSLSTPTTPESSRDQLEPPESSTMTSEQPNTASESSQHGWGTWMWSFIADANEEMSGSPSDQGSTSSGVGRGRQGSKLTDIKPSSTFALFAKSVQVTLKVTHQVQVPLFYSFRHFTTPVLHVSFTGCMAQLDKVPLTTLFLFSMGIGSVSATVTGLCPCVKRFPSSWRRASTATATTTTDSAEQIPVFSMGTASGVGVASTVASNDDEDSCGEYKEKIIELMLKRSLFAPPTPTTTTDTEDTPSTPDSARTIELPPLSNPGLAQLGEHYTAVWFTYQYFDTGPSRLVEECTETLRLGHVTATLSPDVLHRLKHFIQAFGKSLAANRRFSEGMVVLGDPKAETALNVELTGVQIVLTANGHYLSTLSAGSPHMAKSKKSSKKAKKPKSLALPSICVVNSRLTLNFILPMYSGNATLDVPQRTQLKAKLSDLQSGTLTLQRLEDASKRVTIAKGDNATTASEFKQFLHIPSVEFNLHSKKHGGEKEMEKDRIYFQLDIEKIASSLSHTHISKLLFLSGTWTASECYPSSANIDCPAHPGSKLGHLHLSVLNSSVSYSGTDYYSLTSAVIGEVSVAIVKEAAAKRLGYLLPVVYGPINTHQWNSASFYQCSSGEGTPQQQQSGAAAERLVEFYIARPYQNVKNSMFPTFQLSVSGCGVCLDPALLQFIKQLPLEAYYTSTDVGHTHEAMQLPELEDPPTVASPSVAADEAQDAPSKLNLLSIMKGYATKVKIDPIIMVFLDQECTSLLSDSAVDILPEFPILRLLSSDPSPSAPSAVVLALPDVLLESARSHVLDEPVPRETQVDTLPWDCSLADMSMFTIIKRKPRYLLEPLVIKATLAPQQEGSGVTIHLDTLTLAVSKKQVKLVSCMSHDLFAMVTRPLPSSTSSASLEVDDSGIIVSSKQGEPSVPPSSVLSSPAHSTVTPPTHPVGSEVSTVSSSLVFQGFSTLWVQLLVSKLVLNIYNRQKPASSFGSSEYSTPFTSPSAADKKTSSSDQLDGSLSSSGGTEAINVSFEVDGISLQVDIQERCTDMIFKMASMECSYLKKHSSSDDPSTKVSWLPYLSHSNGKLFSTSSSSLPEELSRITDPLSHPLVPFEQAAAMSSPQHPFSPKLQPNFVQLKVKLPHLQLLRTTRLSLSVKPFELVAWLPVLEAVIEVFSAAGAIRSNGSEHKDTKTYSAKSSGGGVTSWPSVELNVECFRVMLPNVNHTHFLLLGVGGVSVTSSLDYAGPDVRYVINSSAFRRLSLLSSERKQPALPAYQVDAISLSLWGVDNSNTSLSVSLFGVCSNLRVVYTPPLCWTPHTTAPPPGSAPLLAPPTVTGSSKFKSSVLATGHCVEVNLMSDVVMFSGTEQVRCLSEVMRSNFIAKRAQSVDEAKPTSPGTPMKFLLVGRSISLSLLTATPTEEITPTSLAPGLATPLMVATVYNPVCVVELSSNITKLEASCFNMAVSFSLEQTSVSYIELAAEPLSSLTSVMKQQLLETRKGQSHDKTGLPPSLLSASWSRQSEDLESGSKAGVISLEIGRPVKLSLSLSFLQEALKTLVQLKKIMKMQLFVGQRNGDDVNQNEISVDDKSSSELFATPQTSMNLSSCEHGDSESDLNLTEVMVTTNQVVVELVLTSSNKANIEEESLTSSMAAQEMDVSLQGEAVPLSSKCVIREGLVVAWQSFTLTIPPGNKLTQTSELSIDSLQLLSIMEGVSVDVVPPVHINCLITQHKPCSTYDLPHSSIKLSCGLLQINLSRTNMELVKRAVDNVTELLQSSNEMAETESCDSEPVARDVSCGREVRFTDDLRTEEFNYIMNESCVPQVPLPGNIVFHHGNGGAPPTMTWQYGEPRTITKLYVLPVPFTITTEEDAPVDIKLSCSLEYWSDLNSCYQALAHFHVSESTHVDWELPSSVSHSSVASRRWRISINHLEWVDEDLEEIITESVTSVSGMSIPLSSVFSPVSLAACTRVDSVFSPHFIPLFSLTVHCHHLHLSLLHHLHQLPSVNTETAASVCYEGYKVVSSHQSQEAIELFRISLDEARLFLRQRREKNTLLKVGAMLKGEYVDRESLVWRCALYPLEADLLLEHKSECKSTSLTDDSCLGLSVSLRCGPTVLRLSQSLVHTTSMAVNLWREEEDTGQTSAAASLTTHYVLCNDTLDDIHFGQVATGEDLLLPSNSCIGYSWRNHKASLQLHVCVVCDGSWRWTKPFSISQDGVQAIDIPIGRYMATLLVKVNLIGGLQKQVTFLGSWKFFSSLHFPLELQLTLVSQSPDTPHSEKEHAKRHSSLTAAPQQLKVLTLQPQQSLPSIVAADSLVGGVRFRMATGGPGGSGRWSKIYPLGSSVHHGQWSKPHLLAELSSENDGPLHFWYNTAPLETTAKKVWGNKICFSPLFAITNHLPYELTVTVTDSQMLPTAPLSHGSSMSTQKEWLLAGGGATKTLYSLSADSWYHLQFQISCKSPVERSDPSLALSTFLLHHLPITKDDQSLKEKTSDNPSTKPAIAYLSLPLGDGSSCTIHAALVRNSLNTITAVLLTELMVVNQCPWEMEVIELVAGESLEQEALWEGKILVGERREKMMVLGPLDKAVCVQKQFILALKIEGIRLTSKPLSFPTLPLSQQKSKNTDSNKTTTAVQMTSDSHSGSEGEPQQVVAEVSLTFLKQDTTITATLKPSYVIHNNTDSCIHAWPSVLSKHDSPIMYVNPDFSLVKEIQPGGVQPILFWQKLSDSLVKVLTPAFRLAIAPSHNTSPSSWSILLSPRFIRHSFSLPTNDPAQSNLPTLLTMHELENTTFLVITRDPSPRLLVQNLCPTVLEVVETDTKGIHASSQLLLPGQEVVYDSPSLAKLYPVVYDSEIASEEETRLHSKAQKVSLCFRVKSTPTQGFREGWSHAYPLANEQDVILGIPEHGDVLISMDRCGHSQFISILPTGKIQPMQRTSNTFAASLTKPSKKDLQFSFSLARFVVCLDDDRVSQKMTSQVLQLVTDEVEILYWRSNMKGTKIELSLRSLQVDNMTVQSSAEFSVVLLPRSEHAARPQLIKNEPPPLVRALIQYNPRMDNVIDLVHVMIQPVTVQLEDSLLHRLRAMLPSFSMPGVLRTAATPTENSSTLLSSDLYIVPAAVLREAEIDTAPLIISRLVIGPSAIYLTASITLKAFLSCRDSPFRFSEYELVDISSNLSEVSQVVAARYVSAVFMHLGWLLGSLELIGSPGTFIQNIGSGLRDLISLPYEGLTRSPGLFILGIGHGAMSFVRNFSTGALTSITNFASSVARNMERLSMDTEHASYQDQKRKEQPTTHFTSGVSTGVSSFGLSLISAVAGIVDQPMQSFQRIDESSSALGATRSVLAGVGKGLIGVVTKPVGGAMELVSHTGQGIMHGTGLIPKLRHKSIGQQLEIFTQPLIKSEFNLTITSCQRKLEYGPCIAMVHAARATVTVSGSEQNVLLLLTLRKLYLLDCHSNTLQQHFSIEHTQLERRDTPQTSGLIEICLVPHSKFATEKKDALSPTNFQTVEYFLNLSHVEAQAELPITASSNVDDDDDSHRPIATQSDAEKSDTSSNVILLVGEQEATQLLSMYQSIRGHILEPELSFCVYNSLMAAPAAREESFVSACSQPTNFVAFNF